jgi:hypothetical protein
VGEGVRHDGAAFSSSPHGNHPWPSDDCSLTRESVALRPNTNLLDLGPVDSFIIHMKTVKNCLLYRMDGYSKIIDGSLFVTAEIVRRSVQIVNAILHGPYGSDQIGMSTPFLLHSELRCGRDRTAKDRSGKTNDPDDNE